MGRAAASLQSEHVAGRIPAGAHSPIPSRSGGQGAAHAGAISDPGRVVRRIIDGECCARVDVSTTEERSPAFAERLVRLDTRALTLPLGVLYAALVVLPLVIGFLLGLAEASVLVSIGALNLLLVGVPYPGKTSARVLAVACGTNALAFGAGTIVGLVPRLLEVPFVALGIFVALWGTRHHRWENVSFFAAVMFVFAVGVPPTTAWGVVLRPSAVLLGGIWALAMLELVSLLLPRLSIDLSEPPGDGPPSAGQPTFAVTGHIAAVAVTATLGFLVGLQLGLPRDYWIMLTVLVALRPDLASTYAYSMARILGTIVGAAAALLITTLTADPRILFPVLAVTTGLCFATRGVNYLVYSVWITLTVILILNLVYSGGPTLAIARVIDTVLGGALALVAALVLSWSGRFRRRQPVKAP